VLNQPTLTKLHAMKLSAMAEAMERQLGSSEHAHLAFEERIGLLVDAEWARREERKLTRRLQLAKLRHAASIEDLDFRASRGLDRQVVLSLAQCGWIRDGLNVLITGLTGTGKSYLACALAERACRSGFSAHYVRTARLVHDLAVARGDGSYSRALSRLAKIDLLVLDDWLLAPLKESERRDLLEVIEDRHERRSTLITSQLPVKAWHDALGEPTIADSICDRLIHGAYQIDLKGKSMRAERAAAKRDARARA
jgi:DNA replication protein DnaC